MSQPIERAKANGLPSIEKEKNQRPVDHPIICIGASAGGMEAIHELFDNLPENTGFSFIVIQHLSSEHKSLMGELLSKHTNMKVLEAGENTYVEPDVVYVIPNNRNISIRDRTLLLSDKESGRSPNMAIDIFLHSLALDVGEKAVAIILSGTGTDGTRGIAEVKRAGGLVFVQDPATARFDGMPINAIASGQIDFILSPESIAEELLQQQRKPSARVIVDSLPSDDEPLLNEILNVIYEKTGCDFHGYKLPTIIRRLTRRMAVANYDLRDYLEFLRQSEEETSLLCKEFLVGVTRFFRDPPAFDELRLKVIPDIIRNKTTEPIKVWVPGCSTGEEVYSIAILIREHMDRLGLNLDVKIFGSDLNREAIETASRGCYPLSIADQVPGDLLDKYFVHEEKRYRVTAGLRRMIVFSQHDLSKDPPFGKLDLISCRNMLIYVSAELQKRLMSIFNFALNVGGYLFLGPSESIGPLKDSMSEVSKKWKIFKKTSLARITAFESNTFADRASRRFSTPIASQTPDRSRRVLVENILTKVLEQFALAGVLVDRDCYLIETFGEYRKYLRLPDKKFDNNLLKMLPARPSILIGAAFRKALATNESTTVPDLRFDPLGPVVNVTIKPLTEPQPAALILFGDYKSPITQSSGVFSRLSDTGNQGQTKTIDEDERRILQHELAEAKETLQKAIEEAETTNEELQSANEELISSNEELQSANEELQSLNEELHTVNAENQLRIKQIIELNDDLNNYFASSDIGQIFLDNNLIIRKYTPKATALVNLIETDVGRPISHISNNIAYQNLMPDINSVLASSQPMTKNIQVINKTWYQMKIMPYLREGRTIDGVVLTFVDITSMKQAELQLKNANKQLKELNDNLMRSNAELEQFAYITSHDLQEPLRKIQTFVDLISRNPGNQEETARYLAKISNSASRMSLLISDVLSYSRLIRADEAKVEVDLNRTLESVKIDFEVLIVEKHADIASDHLPSVKGFPLQLQQLFSNLIGNSIKFSEKPPRIEILAETVSPLDTQVAEELDNNTQYVKITFRDNGIGFDQNYASKVFTIFQRLNHKKVYPGSGIGLALCKRIVDNHRGMITASGVPDQGATFEIYLPAA